MSPSLCARLGCLLLLLSGVISTGLARADEPGAGHTDGQRLLGICQTVLGEQSSFCDVITPYSLEKTVDVPLAEEPYRRATAYTIRLTEGQARYVLGMTSIVTLQGLIPEGTEVRGIVVSLQRATPPDPNAPIPTEPTYTTVAGALIGDADPTCACPYVAPTQGGRLDMTVRDAQGNVLPIGAGNLIDFLDYTQRVKVQLDAVYDLSAGIVLPGDLVRMQTCVQYAPVNDSGVSGCFDAGGAVRSVRACTGFDFEAYAQPRPVHITLEERLAQPSAPWILLNAFRVRSTSPHVTPSDVVRPLPAGAASPVTFEVIPTGVPGTQSVLTVNGDLSCGDAVDCGGYRLCFGSLTNTARLDFHDSRAPLEASATTEVVCAAHRCSPAEIAGCDDADPCTTDSCEVGIGCVNTPHDGACDSSGDVCVGGGQCVGGVCVGQGPVTCEDDQNPCTDAVCLPDLGCTTLPRPNRSACDDGDVCTANDICIAGACRAGATIRCDDQNPCTADTCDPQLGCVHTPVTAGAGSCDDGDLCTVGDSCQAGVCVAGGPATCDGGGGPCVEAICVPAIGCVVQNRPNRSACDDGNTCTINDICVAGVCQGGAPIACDDQNPCTNDGCDPTLGCTHVPRTGGACEDGSVCSTASTCNAGVCSPTAFLECDDGNPCTADVCDPVEGCRHLAVADATTCQDGDPCTGAGTCQAGTCIATAPIDCDDHNPCTDETCLPDEGCVSIPREGSCTTADLCRTEGVCTAGTCEPGPTRDCDDENSCTIDSCDPALGCTHQALPNRARCEDGDPCTRDDICIAGACTAGSTIDCDDQNPCTTDSCNADGTCQHAAVTAPDVACDDGDLCTEDGVCIGSTCVPGAPIVCDDENPCTSDTCSSTQGCIFQNRPNRSACDNDDPCTQDDICIAGVCTPGTPVSCDDGDPCTADTCDPTQGCVHTPISAGPGSCDDGNLCTIGDRCVAGRCSRGSPLVCEDGNSCTADACDPATGHCRFTGAANGAVCDDGNACTGCPWPEPVVTRGYRAQDPPADPRWFPAGRPTGTLELDGLRGPLNGKIPFNAASNLRFLVLPSGQAVLRGTVSALTGTGSRDALEDWQVDLTFTFRGLGRAGQGTTPYIELPTGTQSTYFTDTWEYWTLASGGQLTGPSGTIALSMESGLFALPLQLGVRANGRSDTLGGALPLRWAFNGASGAGVLRVALDREHCVQADQCQAAQCLPGTSRSSCAALVSGDYCTFTDTDFAAPCQSNPTEPACLLTTAFPLLAVERTACAGAPSGIAFGVSTYRRWTFSTFARLNAFFPTRGFNSGAVELCDPSPSTAATAVGRVFALDLSIALSDLGLTPAPHGVPLGELLRVSGPCAGLTVREIARRAEASVSGAPIPYTTCNTQALLLDEVTNLTQGFYRCVGLAEGVALPP